MPSQQSFKKTYAIAKVDEATHTIYGLATSEAVDCENEIADYGGSKEAFQNWSNDFLQRTTAAGQEPSLGNVRVQHNVGDIGGKVTKIDYKDTEKQVWTEVTPVNDEVWEMVKGGFISGLSIGGRVTKTKKEGKYTRYWFTLSELSLVDNPANPEAVFAYVKADGSTELRKFRRSPEAVLDDITANAKKTAQEFAAAAHPEGASMALFTPEQLAQIETVILKKDGKTKRVAGEDLTSSAFAYVGDKNDPSTWKLPLHFSSEEKSKRHVRNALARFNQTKGIPEDEKESVHAKIVAAAHKYGIDVESEKAKAEAFQGLVKAALHKSYNGDEVKKAMWDVGVLAETLQTLSYLYWSCLQESIWEEDDRDDVLAVELAAAIEHLVVILKDMVEEESSELIPALKAAQQELELLKGEKIMAEDVLDIAAELADLAKAGHTLKAHFHKMAAHHEKMAAHHEKMAAHHETMVATHKDMEEAHKACKGKKATEAEGGDTAAFHTAGAAHHKCKAAEHGGLHKSHLKCHEAHKAMAEHCKAMADKHEEGGLPEGDKAAKAAADKAAADALAKAAADKATADAATKAAGGDATLAGVLTDLKKSIDANAEVTAKLQKSVDDMVAAPRPNGTPAVPGVEPVTRGPAPRMAAKAAAADLGI